MASVTPAYLFFELAFNASLLDITSSNVTHQQIQNIECWGRIISGIAVALLVWGMLIFPWASKHKISLSFVACLLAVSLVGSIAVTFSIEKRLLEYQVNQTTPSQRRLAFQLEAAETAIQTGRLNLAGLGSGESLATPAGKTFLSLLPYMAQTVPNFDVRAKSALTDAVAETVRANAPPPAQMFNSTVLVADQKVLSAYQDYVIGERRRAVALNSRQAQEDRAWLQYLQAMRARGLNYQDVPLRYWGQVREMVLQQGVSVPPGWVPDDEATFRRAVDADVVKQANDAYKIATSATTGHPLPLGMSYKQFATIPQIQARWRRGLGDVAYQNDWLTPYTAYPEWQARYYAPLINAQINKKVTDIFQPVADFEPTGVLGKAGRQAMEALLAPPMALLFSVLGAIVHLFKTSRYLLSIPFWEHDQKIIRGLSVVAFGLCLVPFFLPNSMTTSPVFMSLKRDLAQSNDVGSYIEPQLCTWVVQVMPYVYPETNVINSGFRALGFHFEDDAPQFLVPSS